MRHYEEYEEKITRTRLIAVNCDKCGEEILQDAGYDRRDFTLHITTGESYPDGGYKEGWGVSDLCDTCIEWLKGVLIENGVKVSKIEVSW